MEIAIDATRKKVRGVEYLGVMIRQIYSDYNLPILPQDLSMSDLHFWYDALIPGLIELQKQERENKRNAGKKRR